MAHNNGLPKGEPRLVARARYSAACGYAVASIDAAGCGDRPRSAADEQARAELRRATQSGQPVDDIFESLNGPLVEKAAPESSCSSRTWPIPTGNGLYQRLGYRPVADFAVYDFQDLS